MDLGKFMAWLVTVGLILATIGTIGEVTAELKKDAVASHKHGMISLGGWNRRLERGK